MMFRSLVFSAWFLLLVCSWHRCYSLENEETDPDQKFEDEDSSSVKVLSEFDRFVGQNARDDPTEPPPRPYVNHDKDKKKKKKKKNRTRQRRKGRRKARKHRRHSD